MLDAALLAILAVDYILTPCSGEIEVERQVDEKLSLGISNPVVLKIRNRGNFAARLRVRDEPTYAFDSRGNSTNFVDLPRLGSIEHHYVVIPPKRGDFSFGDIYVRRIGLFRMLVRQYKIPAAQDVKVYPDLTLIRKHVTLRQGRILEGRPRRIFGRGTEFESLRDYHPDDEYRNIDWKATARRNKLTSREYQVERSQNVMIMLDVGRTMGIATDEAMTRLDYGVNAAAAIAFAAANAGDQVGLMIFSGEVEMFIPPRKGHSQAMAILQALYSVRTTTVESDYSAAFLHLSHRWRKRSLIVLLTDLIDPDSSRSVITHLAGLARSHLPICLAIGDADVVATAQVVPMKVKDAYRKAVARQVIYERRRAIAELEQAGVIVVDTDGPSAAGHAVETYSDIKARGRL